MLYKVKIFIRIIITIKNHLIRDIHYESIFYNNILVLLTLMV